MTIQEALKIFENVRPQKNRIIIEALNTIKTDENVIAHIKTAVKKQIPKKPITETVNRGISVSGEYDIDFNYLCPNCNTVVGDYETNDVFYEFCPECGQALERSDIK